MGYWILKGACENVQTLQSTEICDMVSCGKVFDPYE